MYRLPHPLHRNLIVNFKDNTWVTHLQRQREEAKRTGRFIDLTNMADDDGEIRQARLAIKREEAEEVAQERQAVVDKAKKEKEKLSTDVVSLP